jgi:hypothetical protein
MSLLSDIQNVVSGILGNEELGRPIIVRRVTTTSGGPGGSPTRSTTDVEANAYFDQVNEFNAPGGSQIQAGDRLAYVDQEVRVQDELVRDGEVFQVVNVNPVELGAGIAIWIAQVRI